MCKHFREKITEGRGASVEKFDDKTGQSGRSHVSCCALQNKSYIKVIQKWEDKHCHQCHLWRTLHHGPIPVHLLNSPQAICHYPRDRTVWHIHAPWLWWLIAMSWAPPKAVKCIITCKRSIRSSSSPECWDLCDIAANILSVVNENLVCQGNRLTRCASKWGKRSEQPTTNTQWQQKRVVVFLCGSGIWSPQGDVLQAFR